MWTCPKCGREFKKTNQDHYCGKAPQTVDAYLALQTPQAQKHYMDPLVKRKELMDSGEYGKPSKQTQNELRHFLDCIRTGRKPDTDGYTALQGLRVIWKLYDAEKQGIVADLRDCALPE